MNGWYLGPPLSGLDWILGAKTADIRTDTDTDTDTTNGLKLHHHRCTVLRLGCTFVHYLVDGGQDWGGILRGYHIKLLE